MLIRVWVWYALCISAFGLGSASQGAAYSSTRGWGGSRAHCLERSQFCVSAQLASSQTLWARVKVCKDYKVLTPCFPLETAENFPAGGSATGRRARAATACFGQPLRLVPLLKHSCSSPGCNESAGWDLLSFCLFFRQLWSSAGTGQAAQKNTAGNMGLHLGGLGTKKEMSLFPYGKIWLTNVTYLSHHCYISGLI